MRTFDELFSRFDPLESEAGGFFSGRLADAVQAARVVLWQRDASQIAVIGREVERLVDGRARARAEATAAALAPAALDTDDLARSALQIWGPLALYLHDEEVGLPISRPELACGARPEEVLAVLALWQAFECRLLLDETEALDSSGALAAADRIRVERSAAAHALDAVRSAELAQASARERIAVETAHDVGLFERTMTEGEIEDERAAEASTSGRIAANVRWAPRSSYVRHALECAMSKPFASRAKAAQHAALQLPSKPRPKSRPEAEDDYYPWTTVDEWLKEAGWVDKMPWADWIALRR